MEIQIMSEVIVSSFHAFRAEIFSNGKRQVKLKKPEFQCHASIKSKAHKYLIRNELAATYSARISTDIPLYEIPGVTPLPQFLLICEMGIH